jgi:hypothetical protein
MPRGAGAHVTSACQPPRRAPLAPGVASLPAVTLAVPRSRPLSPRPRRDGVGAGEASPHLKVIALTTDLIFSTITSASSVPCLPLKPPSR